MTYAASVALALWLAGRWVSSIPMRARLALAFLPLVFTGKAMLLGRLYGPSDLYFVFDPWKRLAAEQGIGAPANPILSDLAFANLPWRAAAREAVVHGHAPLWNRFVLAGTPLLGAAQAGVFHPSTWLGLWLPVPLSWTFSCAFTLFIALLCGFLFFRDLDLSPWPALIGAVGWGLSTYMVFWNGWSVGPSTASFPLLLLGLRRLARAPGRASILLTAAAIWLSICGGHPESAFHAEAAGGLYFLWQLLPRRGPAAARAIGAAAAASLLAVLLAGPQLFPLAQVIPHSAEYRARREALARGGASQSVSLAEGARRLLPDLLPFAHGIYGRSPVQAEREDGSGMPLGYSGAVLFPLALLALVRRRSDRSRERVAFLVFSIAGLAFGASLPGLIDLTARLPGFSLALNYRLVFLAGLGLAGLAALGAQALDEAGSTKKLALLGGATSVVLGLACLAAGSVLAARRLDGRFVTRQLAFEVVPVLCLALAALLWRGAGPRLAAAALVLLIGQRGLEMAGTYPTLPASTFAPALPALAALPIGSEPCRVVAAGDVLRPNAAALYRLEDVRGYDSLVLDRFADTFPLWSQPQSSSFNRVADLTRPFLSFLNACYAIGGPEDPAPGGWREQARGPEMAIFGNPAALPRAFVARRLRRVPDAQARIAEMTRAADFAQTTWLSRSGLEEEENGDAVVRARAAGPDLILSAQASRRTLISTSVADWPGWVAEEGDRSLELETVNHAFVGVWLEAGEHTVRLSYRPASWTFGLAAFAAGCAALLLLVTRRPRAS